MGNATAMASNETGVGENGEKHIFDQQFRYISETTEHSVTFLRSRK